MIVNFSVSMYVPDDTDNPSFIEDQANNLAAEISEWPGVQNVDWSCAHQPIFRGIARSPLEGHTGG